MNIRWKLDAEPDNGWNAYYILVNPTSSNRQLLDIKPDYTKPGGGRPAQNYPYEKGNYKLTKAESDKYFEVPPYWICNDGWNVAGINPSVDKIYKMYDGDNNYGNLDRSEALVRRYSVEKLKDFKGIVTPVSAGTVTIKDNYNNTFTITAKVGASGTNNKAGGPTNLKWGYNTNYSETYTSGGIITLTVSGTGKTRAVYAKATTTAKYGSSKTKTASIGIRQYVGPNAPTGHKITYKKNRLTVKEDWTLSWSAPSINNECPIKGYRIRLYRKRGTGAWTKLHIKNSSGTNLSTTASSGDIYYDREGTSTSIVIYPSKYTADIKAGDHIKFAVTAYTRYGASSDGAQLFKTSEAFSSEYTVQNAGVVRVKVNEEWKEGQVYVKVNDAWKEADVINTNVNGSWKDSV